MSQNSKQVSKDDLQKALNALEDLKKGHNSRGTAATKVEEMSREGGATQVFHTPSNSDPGEWAGTKEREAPDNGATDAISENGTDYDGGAQMVKSILDLLSKGLIKQEAAELLISKAMEDAKDKLKEKLKEKMGGEDEEKARKSKDKGDDEVEKAEDCDDEDKVEKSLSDFVQENDTVQGAFEVSDFLSQWSGELGKSLDSLELRLRKSIERNSNQQDGFNGELVKAISDIGGAVAAIAQRVDQIESQPVGGIRGAAPQTVQYIEKSVGGAAPVSGLSSEQVTHALTELAKGGKIDPMAVLKFDSNGGQLDQQTADAVNKFFQENNA